MKLLKLIILNLLTIPAFLLIFLGITSPMDYIDSELDKTNGVEREPRK